MGEVERSGGGVEEGWWRGGSTLTITGHGVVDKERRKPVQTGCILQIKSKHCQMIYGL